MLDAYWLAFAVGGEVLDLVNQTGLVAKTVLLILLAFSVLSWAIILSKWGLLRRARVNEVGFEIVNTDLESRYRLRRILVYSSANAAGQAKARALKLAKAAAELDKLVRTAGTRFHPTEDAVAARVQAIAAKRRVGKYLRTAITAANVTV